MEKTLPRSAILTAVAVVSLALPAVAAAEDVVPPGNSAATQYTETFPTASGNEEFGKNSSIGGGGGGGSQGGKKAVPEKTAHQLESQGREGRAVAHLAAAGAPPASAPTGGGGEPEPTSNHHAAAGSGGSAGGGSGSSSGGGSSASPSNGGSGQSAAGGAGSGQGLSAQASAGSSGLGQVLGSATGSGAGEMGIFLPLILLAGLVWAIAFSWRRRQDDSQPAPR